MSTPVTIHFPLAHPTLQDGPGVVQRLKSGAVEFLRAYLAVCEREHHAAVEGKIYRD